MVLQSCMPHCRVQPMHRVSRAHRNVQGAQQHRGHLPLLVTLVHGHGHCALHEPVVQLRLASILSHQHCPAQQACRHAGKQLMCSDLHPPSKRLQPQPDPRCCNTPQAVQRPAASPRVTLRERCTTTMPGWPAAHPGLVQLQLLGLPARQQHVGLVRVVVGVVCIQVCAAVQGIQIAQVWALAPMPGELATMAPFLGVACYL